MPRRVTVLIGNLLGGSRRERAFQCTDRGIDGVPSACLKEIDPRDGIEPIAKVANGALAR